MNKNLAKHLKKGFTIVELVIVIAVIGILTAVLVPTFSGLIKRAERTVAVEEANSYVVAYQSWLIEKEQLGYEGIYVQSTDTDYDPSKTYYEIKNGEYCVVMTFYESSARAGEYYVLTGKTFVEYCDEQFGLENYDNVSLTGDVSNSTGFKYITNDNKYNVTYQRSTGKLTVTER